MQFQGFDKRPWDIIHYTMPEKWRPLNCLLVVLAKRNQQDKAIFLNCNLIKQLFYLRLLI